MTRTITLSDLNHLIQKKTLKEFFKELTIYLKEDYSLWTTFNKIPRLATHVPNGVIELMPTSDHRFYSFKYVNGHPNNTLKSYLSVVAFGCLSDIVTGYPVLISEMTVLTAIRTAAISAIASEYLSKKNSSILAIIGTGAQSEFQVIAHSLIRPITTVKFYDTDQEAMLRFEKNLKGEGFNLIACKSAKEAIDQSDIIITATAQPGMHEIVNDQLVKAGMHINGIGGDCPGKTELALATLKRASIVVEFLPQTLIEGEIQRLSTEEIEEHVKGELWELITNQIAGRESDQEITIFDSVGFAMSDYSVLRLVKDLSEYYELGTDLDFIPDLEDPKNLFCLIQNTSMETQKK